MLFVWGSFVFCSFSFVSVSLYICLYVCVWCYYSSLFPVSHFISFRSFTVRCFVHSSCIKFTHYDNCYFRNDFDCSSCSSHSQQYHTQTYAQLTHTQRHLRVEKRERAHASVRNSLGYVFAIQRFYLLKINKNYNRELKNRKDKRT